MTKFLKSSHWLSSGLRDRDQPLKPAMGLPGIDRVLRERHSLPQNLGAARDDQSGGGVEDGNIAERPLGTLEHGDQSLRVFIRAPATQCFRLDPRQSNVFRRDL